MKKVLFIISTVVLMLVTGMVCKAEANVTGVKQVFGDDTDFRIEWTSASQSDVEYEVWVSTSTEDSSYVRDGYTAGNYYSAYNKKPGTTYYVKVRAYTETWNTSTYNYDYTYGPYSTPIKAVTAPATAPALLKETAVSTTSIALSWNSVPGATGYKVEYWQSSEKIDSKKTVKTAKNSINVTGLSKNKEYNFNVCAYRQDGSYTAYTYGSASLYYAAALPSKVAGVKCTSYYESIGAVYLKCNKLDSAKGYQCQVYDGSKIIKSSDNTSNVYMAIEDNKLKKAKFYKARVRAYISVNGQKKYGDWSDWIYISRQPEVNTIKSVSGGLKVNWEKISGADNYTVYVSAKNKSGYKKLGTVKGNSTTIKKYGNTKLKSGTKYYVYVLANKKVGGKGYSSIAEYCWSDTYKKK